MLTSNGDKALYSTFGLSCSSACPLPGFLPAAHTEAPDIDIRFSENDLEIDANLTELGPGVWGDDSTLLIYIADLLQIRIRSGREICVKTLPACDLPTQQLFLTSTALPAALAQRGFAIFRGTAVAWQGKVIAIIGPSSTGKSALGQSLINRGASLLADDYLAIGLESHLYPGALQLKLWADMLASLGVENSDKVRPESPRHVITMESAQSDRPCPIDLFCDLSLSNSSHLSAAPYTGAARFHALEQSVYLPVWLGLRNYRKCFFAHCAELAQAHPVIGIHRPRIGCEPGQMIDILQGLVQ